MTRILYLISTLKRTGPTNILYNLINAIDKRKYEIFLLTLSPEEKGFPSLYDNFNALDISVSSLNLSRINGFLKGRRRLVEFVKQNNIDIIHIYGLRGDILVRKRDFPLLKIFSTINSNIYDDYTMLYGQTKGSIMAWFHIVCLKGKIKVACSSFVKKQLLERYAINMTVIHNGIPRGEYVKASAQEKSRLKALLGIPTNDKVFIFVGYLIERKDPLTVIKAFKLFNQTKNNASSLIVLGDGPLMDKCRDLCESGDKILFLGNKAETLPYLQASDVYIASSRSEGLPTSVMEAMACGLPVILSRIDPHLELFYSEPSYSCFFEYGSVIQLLDQMYSVFENMDESSNIAKRVIENQINSDIMMENYIKLYIS